MGGRSPTPRGSRRSSTRTARSRRAPRRSSAPAAPRPTRRWSSIARNTTGPTSSSAERRRTSTRISWLHDEPALEWAITELARKTGAAVRQQSPTQRERLRAAGLRTPDTFRRDFQHGGRIGVAHLVAIMEEIQDGVTELMCHPGEPDAELAATSAYAADRAEELATLCDPRAATALREGGITLATFADCR